MRSIRSAMGSAVRPAAWSGSWHKYSSLSSVVYLLSHGRKILSIGNLFFYAVCRLLQPAVGAKCYKGVNIKQGGNKAYGKSNAHRNNIVKTHKSKQVKAAKSIYSAAQPKEYKYRVTYNRR